MVFTLLLLVMTFDKWNHAAVSVPSIGITESLNISRKSQSLKAKGLIWKSKTFILVGFLKEKVNKNLNHLRSSSFPS